MKKVIISSLLISLVILLGTLLFVIKDSRNSPNTPNQVPVDKEVTASDEKYEPISFSVIGDVHSDTTRLENSIKDLYEVNSDTDLMIMNGDTVDQGLPEHYALIQNALISCQALLPKNIIKNIGNHEFFDYSKDTVLTAAESKEHISRYLEFSGEKKVYHDSWIKGYHFISLGSEQTNTAEVGSVTALISQEQLKWLEEKLAENYKSGRPIFVLFHQPINNTPPSQQTGWISTKQNVEVYNILSKYPEVVLFSSHTHTYLVSNNMVYTKQPFTAIYTGATRGPLKTDDKGKMYYSEESQGVYAEIADGKLTVRARDFGKKAWVEGAQFTRDLK
jgi:Predicted phosphohydrolases